MKKRFYIVGIILFFLSFFVALNWNSYSAPFERDEGEYAYSAWLMRGDGLPYQDSFLQKPPLIIYTYLLGQVIAPVAVWPPRVLASLFILLTSVLIYLVAKKEWGRRVGVFSAFLFLPLIGFPPLTPFAANTEKFMILPLMGLVALFVYFKNSKNPWVYLSVGGLATSAIFYKPICLPVILFIICFWLYSLYQSENNNKFKAVLRPLALIFSSSLMFAGLLLVPFYKVLPDLFQEVFIFNLAYVGAFDNSFYNFVNYLGKFFHYWWVLLLLLSGLFIKLPKNIFYYFFLLGFSLLAIFSTPIGHYYLMLMPFVALLGGALFGSLVDRLNSKNKNLIMVATFIVVFSLMLFPFRSQLFLSPTGLSEWVYGTVNPFGEAEEVANHLAKITNPEDFVFVAGSEPQIYYYAQRKSPTRFVITYPLNLQTEYRETYQTELVKDLEKNKPEAIVVSQRVHSGLWNEGSPEIFITYLDDLITNDYTIVGGYVWVEGQGVWLEPLDEELIQNASLLLLNKNND